MLYLEYHNYMHKYHMAQKMVDQILDEKEVIFQKTQPQSTIAEHERDYDKSVHVASSGVNVKDSISEAYVIELEQRRIQKRLDDAKSIMQERLSMVNEKEKELRSSKNKYDVVYVMRYLDSMNARDISDNLDYSEPHVFRLLKKISDNIQNMIENERK